jgi:hypothetical protein
VRDQGSRADIEVVNWPLALRALTGLFCLRIVGQPLAGLGVAGLPPFDAWHSGALPYPFLLASQLAIVAWMAWTTRSVAAAAVRWRRPLGGWLLAASCLYGAIMVARLVLGATILRDVTWFARPVPTVFHLVLAAYLGIYGHMHLRLPPREARANKHCSSEAEPAC